MQGINEKQPGTRWDTRFGVTVTFHFATQARNAPLRAAAAQRVTETQLQLELVRRQIAAGIAQAVATLSSADRAVVAADRGASELDKRRGQIERAWKLGEMHSSSWFAPTRSRSTRRPRATGRGPSVRPPCSNCASLRE